MHVCVGEGGGGGGRVVGGVVFCAKTFDFTEITFTNTSLNVPSTNTSLVTLLTQLNDPDNARLVMILMGFLFSNTSHTTKSNTCVIYISRLEARETNWLLSMH